MTNTNNTHTNTINIHDEELEFKTKSAERYRSNEVQDRDYTAFTKKVYQPPSPQQANRNYASVRRAQKRRYQRIRAERRGQFLCVHTGAPLRSLRHLVQGPKLPRGWKERTGKAWHQHTEFYQRYGETQAEMAKRHGVSKAMINKRWLRGQCPDTYYTRKAAQ